MCDFSTSDLIIIAVDLEDEEKERRKVKKNCWFIQFWKAEKVKENSTRYIPDLLMMKVNSSIILGLVLEGLRKFFRKFNVN